MTPTTNTQTIRDAIREAMREQGISQGELARRTGMARTRVNDYLAGRRDFWGATLDRVFRALGMPREW